MMYWDHRDALGSGKKALAVGLGAWSRKERWAVGAFLSSPQEMQWGDGTWKSARNYLSAEKINVFHYLHRISGFVKDSQM